MLTCGLLTGTETPEDTTAEAETLENKVEEDSEAKTEEAVVRVTRHQDKSDSAADGPTAHKIDSGESKRESQSGGSKASEKREEASESDAATLGKGYAKGKPGYDAEYKSEKAEYKDRGVGGGAETTKEKFSASGGHQVETCTCLSHVHSADLWEHAASITV